jgi:glycosyltransferase involved in cell wall biosynthesis
MTRVLVVAYYFPPKGGAGTQRFAKFCKYLPEHGIDPIVLSAGANLHNRNAPHDDPTLVSDSPVHVERVDDPEHASWRLRLQRRLRFFIDEDEWAVEAAQRAVALAQQQKPEAVVTTLSPYACYRVGERLKREFGLPWILDLRDPWALDGWRRYRSWVHARHDLNHMRRALRGADFVIANVPEAAAAYVALGADPARTVVIPNGFDEEDFAREQAKVLPSDGRFQLVHMGTFHAANAAPGVTRNSLLLRRHRQIEPLGRTGYYLLNAMSMLKKRSLATYGRLRVHLFGNVDATHREVIDWLGVNDGLSMHGYVSHRDSIAALCGADAVFVPLHGVPVGERAMVVPGKLYEALASQRAVLAALPPGDGADLVRHLNAGVVVPATDASALCDALEAMIDSHVHGEPKRGCLREAMGVFTRRHLTGLLAQVLRAAVQRQPGVSIEDPWSALGVRRA